MSQLGDELEEIRASITAVVERLDDLAFRELRSAVARGDQRRPEIERRVTRARNALLRTMPLLTEAGEAEFDGVPEQTA